MDELHMAAKNHPAGLFAIISPRPMAKALANSTGQVSRSVGDQPGGRIRI